ncbi:hypothetical protein [Embleya sp. NPDC020886]|uniref:hypothetical protein n=1 Tax=Embleya sp. NPDC020886 TaxID=3363980 RepID=UPI003794037A
MPTAMPLVCTVRIVVVSAFGGIRTGEVVGAVDFISWAVVPPESLEARMPGPFVAQVVPPPSTHASVTTLDSGTTAWAAPDNAADPGRHR